MQPIGQLCKLRKTVFDRSLRDIVLDLSDLTDNRINPQEFFVENYITDGMRVLFREAFRRFAGQSTTGIVKLTQSMGGGKTHNMIALGLLAQHPELRQQFMPKEDAQESVGKVRVVAFTGRESDAPFGVWGAIAEQLGKKDLLKDYYSPLKAPGQTAWINLLQGDPLLILLDELPPYLENAQTVTVGNSDLSVVTTTALANLFTAMGKDELANVCIVISDLKATYQSGTQKLNNALQNLDNEAGRVALNLEPVALNTDEVYHILRKRLFEDLPTDAEITKVAWRYGQALKDANQMDVTNASPEKFATQIRDAYPFHPAIKDLYARFKENPGFQQTRGLIKLMRILLSRLFDSGRANQVYLIHPYDLDLNDRETLAEITAINPTLDTAISHDVAASGQAIAEIADHNLGGTDCQDISKLILVASLSNIPHPVLGITTSEIIAYLCAPGRDISRVKQILDTITTSAWYLHTSSDGKIFFKNTQNLIAKLKSTAESYNRESTLKELRKILERIFAPSLKDCYQEVLPLPPLDEVKINQDKVSLLLYEPYGGGLHPDLNKFYDDLVFKNRVLFLSGQKETLESLIAVTKEYKAISFILEDMEKERIPENDPQRMTAIELLDKIRLRMLSAARETFTSLTYPMGDKLMNADFYMNYEGNDYRGESRIRDTLKFKQKFTEDVSSDTFRKKCEQRLFTQKQMPWSEVKKRAAMNIAWQWHHTDALDSLKNDLVHRDQWREDENGYVEKGPFPPPCTDVQIQELNRNDQTGEVTLKINPVHGDQIFYEINGPATTGSLQVENLKAFKTTELNLSFLCRESKGEHETGEPRSWKNRITIQSRTFQAGTDKMVELQAAPAATIQYTTNGSDPKLSGGIYTEPFVVPKGTIYVLAVAQKDGISSALHKLEINWDEEKPFTINPMAPIKWKRLHEVNTTKQSYELLDLAKKYNASLSGVRVSVVSEQNWLELNFNDKMILEPDKLRAAIENMRSLLSEGQVAIETNVIHFLLGQDLTEWVAEVKTEITAEEVEQ
jgi:hypothetical protein